MSGLIFLPTGYSRETIQTEFDSHTIVSEKRTPTGTSGFQCGYLNTSFPANYNPSPDTTYNATAGTGRNLKTILYYDDLAFLPSGLYNFDATNAYETQWTTPPNSRKGLLVGSVVRNITTNAWMRNVMYYDFMGKLIQDFHQTNRNNIIRNDYQYRFNGELLKVRKVKKQGSTILSTKILSYDYDHTGRKIRFKYSLNGAERTIAKYSYDEIGRLKQKTFSPSEIIGSKQTGSWLNTQTWLTGNLPTISDQVTINQGHTVTIPVNNIGNAGSLFDKGTLRNEGVLNLGNTISGSNSLQKLDYKYHIRGGMKGINLDASGNLSNSIFSYKLDYEDDGTYYDGNIRKQSWKSNLDNVTRSYTYSYDGSSRILQGLYTSTKANENYNLNSVGYDANGNILGLSRNGATNLNYTTFGNVDNLTYSYKTNSNKLTKIQDATSGNTDLGDFRDGINTGDDYEYWSDGSLKKDKNKKIASITYNYLKRPEIITFDNARTIITEYDAKGTKLKKIDSNGEVTDYEEDEIYVNGVLYQTSHDEGRIANGIFEYNITDHNNDLRISFRDSAGIAVPTQSIFYDPWGLTMKGMQITKNPANFNKYQFLNRETQFETGYIDLINRQFDPQIGRFTSQDPVTDGQEDLTLYQYGWNNPVLKPDPNGDCPLCPAFLVLPEIGAGLVAAGEAITGLLFGGASGTAISMGVSSADRNANIPYSAQLYAKKVESEMANQAQSKPAQTNQTASTSSNQPDNKGKEKTHQTYTKDPKDPSKDGVYSGKTSGKGTPEQNVAKRDKGHHMNDTHEKAKLDQTSSSSDAIRGQEQRNIVKYGGAKSQGGTSGNQNNGINPKNEKKDSYLKAAEKEFGKN
jgi:RHS repeat-associated protein